MGDWLLFLCQVTKFVLLGHSRNVTLVPLPSLFLLCFTQGSLYSAQTKWCWGANLQNFSVRRSIMLDKGRKFHHWQLEPELINILFFNLFTVPFFHEYFHKESKNDMWWKKWHADCGPELSFREWRHRHWFCAKCALRPNSRQWWTCWFVFYNMTKDKEL